MGSELLEKVASVERELRGWLDRNQTRGQAILSFGTSVVVGLKMVIRNKGVMSGDMLARLANDVAQLEATVGSHQ